jgi:hypothetical protein
MDGKSRRHCQSIIVARAQQACYADDEGGLTCLSRNQPNLARVVVTPVWQSLCEIVEDPLRLIVQRTRMRNLSIVLGISASSISEISKNTILLYQQSPSPRVRLILFQPDFSKVSIFLE